MNVFVTNDIYSSIAFIALDMQRLNMSLMLILLFFSSYNYH